MTHRPKSNHRNPIQQHQESKGCTAGKWLAAHVGPKILDFFAKTEANKIPNRSSQVK